MHFFETSNFDKNLFTSYFFIFLIIREPPKSLTNGDLKTTFSDLKSKPIKAEVELRDYSASWDPEQPNPTLKHVNMKGKAGQLLSIIGPVGAGKVRRVL